MPEVDPRFTRSVARWLRAYPRRWRTARAAEVTEVLADLAPEGARRLDPRSGLGLVRAGWATRWREHPPLMAWLGYVLLEHRLDPRHRDWARDDIEGPLHAVRRAVMPGLAGLLVCAVLQVAHGEGVPTGILAAWVPFAVVLGAAFGPVYRRRAISRQLVVQPGEVVTTSSRIPAAVARRRTAARPWLTAATVAAAVALVVCAAVVALAPRVVTSTPCGAACLEVTTAPVPLAYRWAVLAVAVAGALTGLLLSRGAARRLRRWTPAPQPHRRVVPLGVAGWTRSVLLLAAVALVAAVAQPLAVVLAGPVAVVACGALPVLVAACRVVDAGSTRAASGIEVLRAVAAVADPPDQPVDGHVAAGSWLPVGTVVPRPGDPPPHR